MGNEGNKKEMEEPESRQTDAAGLGVGAFPSFPFDIASLRLRKLVMQKQQ